MWHMPIKQTPEDFRVEEVLSAETLSAVSDQPRPFALYRLTKQGLTTPEAAERIARALRVPPAAVAVAGLKDKHATTVQHVTVRMWQPSGGGKAVSGGEAPADAQVGKPVPPDAAQVGKPVPPDAAQVGKPVPPAAPVPQPVKVTAPKRLEARNWMIERLGFLDAPLDGSAIGANRFRITVFGLTPQACRSMDGAAELLACGEGEGGRRLRFVNYFGRQRFGTTRHGQGFLARRLLAGKFEEALRLAIATPATQDRAADKQLKQTIARDWGRWQTLLPALKPSAGRAVVEVLARGGDFREAFAALPYFTQQINVEAYQSYLWNATASRLIRDHYPADAVWEGDDPLKLMVFAKAQAAPPELLELNLPLLGPRTELAEPWGPAAKAVLEKEGLEVRGLRIPGMHRPFFGELPRRLLAECSRFEMAEPEADAGGDDDDNAPRRLRRIVSFELPRGAYATVLLAALGQ